MPRPESNHSPKAAAKKRAVKRPAAKKAAAKAIPAKASPGKASPGKASAGKASAAERAAKQPAANLPSRRKEKRLPAAERAQELLEAAMELFADKGPAVTVQNLADKVNVTQPLVHRYFPTKADLIDAIRQTLQNAHWDPGWQAILTDRSRPLEERIVDFYEHYLPHIYRRTWYRGFWFLALGEPEFAQAYLDRVTEDLLSTIIAEARHYFGYPTPGEVALDPREIELVWGMHSTPVFQGVRRFVYQMKLPIDPLATVRDNVRGYMLSLPILMQELMGSGGPAVRRGPARRSGGKPS